MATLRIVSTCGAALLAAAGFMISRAQDPVAGTSPDVVSSSSADGSADQLSVSDPSCTYFGANREKFVGGPQRWAERTKLTADVTGQLAPAAEVMTAFATSTAAMPSAPGGSRTDTLQHGPNNIDKYLFQAMTDAHVAPAPPTTDFEFVRRVTLDLTGRIPTPDAVTSFVNDASFDKRAKLIDSLIASPEWVDKWTIWFGDFFQNNSRNTQIQRYIQGVVAFNDYIRNSLTSGKPYDQMARDLISATGPTSFTQGELNYIAGGVMGGGPVQDVFDLQAANVADTFLGISHLNCLLCHNGRGHLDSLSLWGYYTTRQQAWGMASFMSRTSTIQTGQGVQPWSLTNNRTVDYQLNTTTGNRPARCTMDANGRCVTTTQIVKPAYITDGVSPAAGQDYRTFLGQKITSDFQFARATVNYIWEYFFGMGIVSPSNQFDPMRLDPDHPPTDCPSPSSPCTLQPTNARLLNALAQDFINSGYNLKSLMREIVTSRAYQLSSRYDGTWDPNSQTLFARHLVRRLWSEELADSIAQSSGIPTTYTNVNWNPTTVSWAMKLPEPLNTGGNGTAASQVFLDAFLRGNRDDQERRGEGSISQALDLMNDNFVMQRVNSTAATSLIVKALAMPNDQLVNTLFLNVLSRYPTSGEMSAAIQNLQTQATRTQEARYLYWSLYNKVDFVFNY
ncbi:MAG: hypothetical protein JWO19_2487 [Bryobacterales bacterium]|nr:hypothetical protein [Bryobacterales bacterium]